MQSNIKQKTSSGTLGNQTQEGERVIVTNIRAHSPLPKIPDMTNLASILENKLKTSEDSVNTQDTVDSSECVSAQPAPITLMPLPLVPTHNTTSGVHHLEQSEAVYADPVDCIKPVPKLQPTTAQYIDPANVLPLHPPTTRASPVSLPPNTSTPTFTITHQDSVYSEVYDKISPVQDKPKVVQINDEPIYAEPVSEKESPKKETKPDPFAHLYAQVHKPPKSPSTSPSSSSNSSPCISVSSSAVAAGMTTANSSDDLDDVIYENLGII